MILWLWPGAWPTDQAAGAPVPIAARSTAPVPIAARSIDARMDSALAAGRWQAARAAAESALALRRTRAGGAPLAMAAYLDTLGLRFFAAGTPEAWQVASGYFERALALREKTLGPTHLEVARTLGNLSTLLDYQGLWPDALRLERRALAIRTERLGERDPSVAASHRHAGMILYQLARYAEAETTLAAALALYDSLGQGFIAQRADALNNMGEISRVQDKYRAAASYFERGMESARAGLPPDDPRRAALLNNLAGLYKDLGRYDEAEPLLRDFLTLAQRAPRPDPETVATANLNLAEVYRLQGRLAEAEPLYARALETARSMLPAGSPDLAPFVSQAAVVLHAVGRYDQAEPLYRESLSITERALGVDHPLFAQSLHDLAGLLTARGNYREAEDTYRRVLEIRERAFGARHPEIALTRVDLAHCLTLDPAAGDSAAAPLVEQAIAALDTGGSYPEARLEAFALRARLNARGGRLADAIADMTAALVAVDALRSHRGGGEETRAEFVARHLELFDQMVAWRLERGEIAPAFEAHETARARVLLDQLTASSVDLRAGIPPEVLGPLDAREQEARERLAQHQRRLQETRARSDLAERARSEEVGDLVAARDAAAWDLQRAREDLREKSPLWRDVLNAGGRPASLAQAQRELVARGELLLVYHAGPLGSYVFVLPAAPEAPWFQALAVDSVAARELRITPGPLTSARLDSILVGRHDGPAFGSTAGLASLLGLKDDEARMLPSRPGTPGPMERRLRALARVLVPDALWRQARKASEVVIVPDGALHLLPFEALVARPRAGGRKPRYWLDDGPPIRYAASATSLLSLTQRSPAGPVGGAARLLSVTDPAFAPAATAPASVGVPRAPERAGGHEALASALRGERRGWTRLPGTAHETAAIRRAFAPDSVVVLAGLAAREARVRSELPGKRFLHFATHGFVTEARSEVLAGLVLTPPAGDATGARDDGFLQLYEIYELPLRCELAVLSACETQRGPRVAGEGVFALSRGFLAAGARRVIASLWAVNDESTAALMGRCFAAIARADRAGRAPRYAAALRAARRHVRAQARWEDPFYWAPFTLSGLR